MTYSTANILALAARAGIAHNSGTAAGAASGEILLCATPEQLDRFVASLQEDAPIRWPIERDVARCGDMDTLERTRLRVLLDGDNDVIVEVLEHREGHEHATIATIEFCHGGGGGGSSTHTRRALLALMVAIKLDNEAAPHKRWPQ